LIAGVFTFRDLFIIPPSAPSHLLERTGVQRELPDKLYDGDAGIACDGLPPGASARNRYALKHKSETTNERILKNAENTS
jgi:hypothetical protein